MLGGFFKGGWGWGWFVVSIKISDIDFFLQFLSMHIFLFTPMTEFYLNANPGMLI